MPNNNGTIPQNWVAVQLLRGLVTALWSSTPRSHLVPVQVTVCCDQSIKERDFPQIYQLPFSVSFHQHIVSIHLFIHQGHNVLLATVRMWNLNHFKQHEIPFTSDLKIRYVKFDFNGNPYTYYFRLKMVQSHAVWFGLSQGHNRINSIKVVLAHQGHIIIQKHKHPFSTTKECQNPEENSPNLIWIL